MTENNRFCKGEYTNCRYDICEIEKDGEIICTVALEDADFIIGILEENKELKKYKEKVEKLLFNATHSDVILSKIKTKHTLEAMAYWLDIDLD